MVLVATLFCCFLSAGKGSGFELDKTSSETNLSESTGRSERARLGATRSIYHGVKINTMAINTKASSVLRSIITFLPDQNHPGKKGDTERFFLISKPKRFLSFSIANTLLHN